MRGAIPFRRSEAERADVLQAFAARPEIGWFGFEGRFDGDRAIVELPDVHDGHLGGGGRAALNGGVITAGFDAAAVLAGLGHYATSNVVTVSLSVQFLALALLDARPRFEAWAVASSRDLIVVEAVLAGDGVPFATANAILKPVFRAAVRATPGPARQLRANGA